MPPKITPNPNRGEMKMNPAKPEIAATKPIVHKIRRCEIGGGGCSVIKLSDSSLIAKHKFYKVTAEKAKVRKFKGEKVKRGKVKLSITQQTFSPFHSFTFPL